MKIFNLYIIRELIGPTLLGFSFYTFIMLTQSLFELAEVIIRESAGIATIGSLLLFSVPHIIVLTIPMALLFGILIAIGRLSSDSEIIAMRASGLSLPFVYRPVFYFSLFVFFINLFLINVVMPYGNQRLHEVKTDLASRAFKSQIEPRVFYDEFDDLVLYVDEIDRATNEWSGVFIAGASAVGRENVILAENGYLVQPEGSVRPWLRLEDASNHISRSGEAADYHVVEHGEQRIAPRIGSFDSETTYDFRSMSLPELIEIRPLLENPVDDRTVTVEIHKKFSIPFACIAFGLLALPLGLTNRRGGRSSGFSLSIGIILIYYVLLTYGEDLASEGKLPAWLGMWAANAILLAGGLWLLIRANRDIQSRSRAWYRRIAELATRFPLRRREEQSALEAKPSLLQRLDVAFPNTIDRYILKTLFKVLGLVLLSTLTLFIIVNYTEIADDIRENEVAFGQVLAFYRYYSLQMLEVILPLSILIGTLITFAILSRNSEIVAMKASGISLYRLAVPVLVVASLMAGVSYLLLDFVLPYSNRRFQELKGHIKGVEDAASTFSVGQQRQWVFGQGRWIFSFASYDPRTKSLADLEVLELHPEKFALARRVFAREARFDGVGWVLFDGWIRSFDDDGTVSYSPIIQPVRLHYPERPDYFSTEIRAPDQMTFFELKTHIRNLKRAGYDAAALQVELFRKTSWPFLPLVMALIALPFSFRMGKRGALYGIGVALFLAFGYWMLFVLFTEFGKAGNLPPLIAAWSANILFIIAALYMSLRVDT